MRNLTQENISIHIGQEDAISSYTKCGRKKSHNYHYLTFKL